MITANVLRRVFQIVYGDMTGTGFTIDVANRQYLVTARHVIEGIKQKDQIKIYHEGTWTTLAIDLAWMSPGTEDVAILYPCRQLSPTFRLEPSSKGMVLGQTVYFCGFPYGLRMESEDLNAGSPLCLVKHGIVSAGWLEGRHQLIIDGHNNVGFSGGPVVFAEPGAKDYKVGGVISGFRPELEPILIGDEDTGLRCRHNTGLIIASYLDNGVKYITRYPTGVKPNLAP